MEGMVIIVLVGRNCSVCHIKCSNVWVLREGIWRLHHCDHHRAL